MTLGMHTAMQRARAERAGTVTPYWTPMPASTKLNTWTGISMRWKEMENMTCIPVSLVGMMMEMGMHQPFVGHPPLACTPAILQSHHSLNPLHRKVLPWIFLMVRTPLIFNPLLVSQLPSDLYLLAIKAQSSPTSLPVARAQSSPTSLPVVRVQSNPDCTTIISSWSRLQPRVGRVQ